MWSADPPAELPGAEERLRLMRSASVSEQSCIDPPCKERQTQRYYPSNSAWNGLYLSCSSACQPCQAWLYLALRVPDAKPPEAYTQAGLALRVTVDFPYKQTLPHSLRNIWPPNHTSLLRQAATSACMPLACWPLLLGASSSPVGPGSLGRF